MSIHKTYGGSKTPPRSPSPSSSKSGRSPSSERTNRPQSAASKALHDPNIRKDIPEIQAKDGSHFHKSAQTRNPLTAEVGEEPSPKTKLQKPKDFFPTRIREGEKSHEKLTESIHKQHFGHSNKPTGGA